MGPVCTVHRRRVNKSVRWREGEEAEKEKVTKGEGERERGREENRREEKDVRRLPFLYLCFLRLLSVDSPGLLYRCRRCSPFENNKKESGGRRGVCVCVWLASTAESATLPRSFSDPSDDESSQSSRKLLERAAFACSFTCLLERSKESHGERGNRKRKRERERERERKQKRGRSQTMRWVMVMVMVAFHML